MVTTFGHQSGHGSNPLRTKDGEGVGGFERQNISPITDRQLSDPGGNHVEFAMCASGIRTAAGRYGLIM